MRPIAVAALMLATFASAAPAEPLPAAANKEVWGKVMESTTFLLAGIPDRAQAECRAAEEIVARYDRDPFYDAFIADCFANVERKRKNKGAACEMFARAIEHYQAVPAGHSKSELVPESLKTAREEHARLGC